MRYKYLVVSALQEELDEFLKKVNPQLERLELDVALGRYKHNEKTIEVFTFSADKMGMPYNAAKLMQIVLTYQPQNVLFIGICAGLKGHNLGSVLVPRRVFSYESGKLEKGEFWPDYSSYETSEILRRRAQSLKTTDFNSFGYEVVTDEDFCSGSMVLNDEEKVKEIITHGARKLSGLEMEAYAVACINDILKPSCNLLVIKGISDKAINKETREKDGSREQAKRNAADFAFRLINYLEITNQVTSDPKFLSIDPQASLELTANFKLKLKFNVKNISNYPIVVESESFEYVDHNLKNPSAFFQKPTFLIGKDFSQKDIYKEKCLLLPGEKPLSCWMAINPSVGEEKLRELIVAKKVGKWSVKSQVLDNTYPFRNSISV